MLGQCFVLRRIIFNFFFLNLEKEFYSPWNDVFIRNFMKNKGLCAPSPEEILPFFGPRSLKNAGNYLNLLRLCQKSDVSVLVSWSIESIWLKFELSF